MAYNKSERKPMRKKVDVKDVRILSSYKNLIKNGPAPFNKN